VRLDGAGNPRLLLTTESNDMPLTTGAAQPAYGGNGDLFVAKFNAKTGVMEWGSYIGGSQNESTETHEFAVDAQGNSYVVAPTQSSDFLTTAGAFQRKFGGVHDIFAAKISPDGKHLLASTLIGGSGADRPEGVAVDPQGNVYFTGTTTSPNFPTTPNAFQSALRGKRDAIAVIIAADFSRLLYSSYFGGSDLEYGRGAVVGPDLFAFGGETASADMAVRNALQPRYGGAIDAFVVRLSTKGLTTR
jgi:hypothetical protein